MRRLSHSQINIWKSCRRYWELSYLKKLKVPTDTYYADAGNVVHHVLEEYNKNRNSVMDLDSFKKMFDAQWNKYKLDYTPIKDKKDDYWLMCINGFNEDYNITLTEFMIFYPDDFICYIDGINEKDEILIDWKTSTPSSENKHTYTEQLKQYAWMYYRKFKRLPNKCITHYLKQKSKNIEYIPTIDDINKVEKDILDIQNQIDHAIEKNEFPKCCDDGSLCDYFCPYREVCFNTNNFNVVLDIIGNNIFIKSILPPIVQKKLIDKFSYEKKDSYFIKKNSNWDAIVRLYNPKRQMLGIGFMNGLKKTLNDYAEFKKVELKLTINDYRTFNKKSIGMPDKLNGIELRPYQKDTIDIFMKEKIGFSQLATASGKTVIATEIIRKIDSPTIFIVNKKELMYQTKKRLDKHLGTNVGLIGDGNDDVKPITVAMIQTLHQNIRKYAKYLSLVRLSICDEGHAIASMSYRKVMRYLVNTEFRLTITATAYRDDKEDMLLEEGGGKIIVNITPKYLMEKGYIMYPKIIFYKVNGGQGERYSHDYDLSIVDNMERNELICKLVNENIHHKILILTKKVVHGEILKAMIPGSIHIYGDLNKNIRIEQYNNFVSNDSGVMIATISIASEGLDIPDLDVVINASGNAGDVKSVQVLGRVLRKFIGKEKAYYFDFFDSGKYTSKHSKIRYKKFINEEYDVEIIGGKENGM